MIFNDLNDLVDYIIQKKDSISFTNNRFPVRFIFLNTFNELKELINLLKNSNKIELLNIFEIESFIDNNKDCWFTISEIINIVKNINYDSFIYPLYDIFRFYTNDDLYSIFQSIAELENNSGKFFRLYIPIVGLYNRFNNFFWQYFTRKNEYDPRYILKSNSNESLNIFFISYDIELPKNNKILFIKNSFDFFNIWKYESINEKKIIVGSKILNEKFNNEFDCEFYSIFKISNAKEFIKYVFSMELNIKYDENEKNYWHKLINIILDNDISSKKELFENYFNIKDIKNLDDIEVIKLILKLKDSDEFDFDLWFLKIFILDSENYKNKYISEVFNDLYEYDLIKLTKLFYFKIFELRNSNIEAYVDQRLEILRFIYNNLIDFSSFESEIMQKLNQIPKDKLLTYITGLSNSEKIFLLQNFSFIVENKKNNIKKLYPELFYYIDDERIEDFVSDSFLLDYLKEYKKTKLLNAITDGFQKLINNNFIITNSDTFFQFMYSYQSLKNKANNLKDIEKIFQIDGLGIEFCSYILNLLEEEIKDYSIDMQIVRCELPSITQLNKIDNAEFYYDLDQYIHSNRYIFPKSMIEELKIIKNIIEKIIYSIKANNYQSCVITGDHGFSTMVISSFLGKNRYNYENEGHGGRYISIDKNDNFKDGEEYVVLKNDYDNNRYLIPFTHTSLGKTNLVGESHGGATIEEMLIPFITLTKKVAEEKYEIKLLNNKIPLRTPEIKIQIRPKITDNRKVKLIFNEKSYNFNYESSSNSYVINLNDTSIKILNTGKYKFKIKINKFIKEIEIEFYGGFKQEEIL